MPNFAPPHKAGPRRNELILAFCCGSTAEPSKNRTMTVTSTQCRCGGFSSRTRNTGSPLWQNKTKAPRKFRGAAVLLALGRGFGLNLDLGFAVANRDLTRLFRLGDLAHEIYVQRSVLEVAVLDFNIVSNLEDAPTTSPPD